MLQFLIIVLITFLAFFFVLFANEKNKANVVIISVLLNSAISSWFALKAIGGKPFEFSFDAGYIIGMLRISVDALSGWFILLMNFTVITSILYGKRYLLHYQNQTSNLNLHYISFLINHFAMIGIYVIQNSLAFLCVWEMMAISAFILVIFENWKAATLKAGINYLIQSHVSIIFIMLAFMWVASNTGSYDFNEIKNYSNSVTPEVSFLLFIFFFIGFAIKAGFVPFHTWLPHAHPAAPAHISGLMSGVLIKLGIFGILRILLLIQNNYLTIGYFILIISVISGLYGVILAIVQHNLKKLLAYHSIENIGIIGIGIGLGSIGLAIENQYLIFAGFAGALLHTLNHSLFKSLLFYCAGTIYQTLHNLNIDSMGGLIKKMPKTATVFLIASLAICGLPPFNGFISEFLIYLGFFEGLHTDKITSTFIFIMSITSLVLIGGLAMLCFTKAFGIIFLGQERSQTPHNVEEAENSKLFPKYLIVILIVAIGLLPQIFINFLATPIKLFAPNLQLQAEQLKIIDNLQTFSFGIYIFITLIIAIYFVKKLVTRKQKNEISPTWGCGYVAPNYKMQYTASSFVRTYRKLIRPLIKVDKHQDAIKNVIPSIVHSETHLYDKIETIFIEKPVRGLKSFFHKFEFLQNGSMQVYILYGILFIVLIIIFPILNHALTYVYELLKKL